jgi:hypothetical protein
MGNWFNIGRKYVMYSKKASATIVEKMENSPCNKRIYTKKP